MQQAGSPLWVADHLRGSKGSWSWRFVLEAVDKRAVAKRKAIKKNAESSEFPLLFRNLCFVRRKRYFPPHRLQFAMDFPWTTKNLWDGCGIVIC